MKNKKNFKLVSIITVLCIVIAYFAVMSPTTAYFYESTNKVLNFDFALLETQQVISQKAVNMYFKGSTKIEDFEENLFDDVAFTQTVTLTNSGDIPAKIYVDVPLSVSSKNNGLKYIVLFGDVIPNQEETTAAAETTTVEAGTTQAVSTTAVTTTKATRPSGSVKGSLKTEIENTLNEFDSSFVSGISTSAANTVLNNYNSQFMNYNKAPVLQLGESVEIRVVFWVAFDNFKSIVDNYPGLPDISYNAKVIVYAAQNIAEAVPTTSAY